MIKPVETVDKASVSMKITDNFVWLDSAAR